jgi:hypothetical protein
VGGANAGKLTGLTNSCSIAAGILGNLCTGVLVQATHSYAAVFAVRCHSGRDCEQHCLPW